MNCRDFELVVPALERKQLLDVATRDQALNHAEICVQCANRFAEERSLFDGVRSVVAEMARAEAPAHLEATLLEAFREHVACAASPTVVAMPLRNAPRQIWKLAAVAAAILLLISGMALFWQGSSAPNHPKEAILPVEQLVPDAEPSHRDQMISGNEGDSRKPSRERRRPPRSSLSELEVATEFFPLREGDEADSFEGGQIVRVELSGSALITIGLPGGAESAGEVVEADVVLGHDGLARAIRFVR